MEQDDRVDVAISFAGEDRGIASEIASGLYKRGFRVFYDRFFEYEMWGKDLESYLGEIFSEKARYCLILLSSHYVGKRWPRYELEQAMSRQHDRGEYILLLRLDETSLEEFPPTIGYLDYERCDYSPTKVVELIEKKLRQEESLSERARLRASLHELAGEIIYQEGVVRTLGLQHVSPGDQSQDFPELDELEELRREYDEQVKEYSEEYKEYYDPLSWHFSL